MRGRNQASVSCLLLPAPHMHSQSRPGPRGGGSESVFSHPGILGRKNERHKTQGTVWFLLPSPEYLGTG